jgi:hypothetical protein
MSNPPLNFRITSDCEMTTLPRPCRHLPFHPAAELYSRGPNSDPLRSLTAEVLAEARDESGTWALSILRRISELLTDSHRTSFESFLGPIIERLCSDDPEPTEKFKLAQLCSMIHISKNSLVTKNMFDKYRDPLLEAISKAEGKRLAEPLGRLIMRLFEETGSSTEGQPRKRMLRQPSPRHSCLPNSKTPPF